MQVQTINIYNNQTSFCAIYKPKNVKFNRVQEPIVEAIKKAMREPSQKFKGKTAEGFYKSKGYDFGIEPYGSDSVYLNAYKGMKETDICADKKYSYLDYVSIGEYSKNSEFKISDISREISNKAWANGMFTALLTAAICGMLATVGLNVRQSMNTKPLTEKVDSVANKAKVALSDSTKMMKTIKK